MLSLRPIIHLILHPVSIGALLLLLALITTKYGWLTTGRLFWMAGGLWFFVMIFTPIPQKLVLEREARYPMLLNPNLKIENSSIDIDILVLASGFTNDTTLAAANRLSGTMLRRVSEGVRIYHLMKEKYQEATAQNHPKIQLTLSGPAVYQPVSQARLAAEAAVGLGVNPQDTRLLEHPLNTWQEAKLYALQYQHSEETSDARDHPLILVTSAIHMPRALYLFRKKGINPLPAPTAHLVKREQLRPQAALSYWKPGLEGIKLMKSYLHETVGMFHTRYFLG